MRAGRLGWAFMVSVALTPAAPARGAAAGEQPMRLCVLDQAAMIQRSRLAQEMGARFQKIRLEAQAKIADDRRTLDADARALDGLRNAISPAVAKARDAAIADRREQLKAREDQINRNLRALDDELTANALKMTEPVVRAVETERKCSMLIAAGTILHLDDLSLDITPMVIDRINATPQPPAPPRR